MIEVRKLIPQVYNQSRDFSVFMGSLQILLNELDQKSRVLESLPADNLLLGNLSTYPEIKSYFRTLLKNKGSNQCILYAISLCGGELFSFDEETAYLESIGIFTDYLNRTVTSQGVIEENPQINKEHLVYYESYTGGLYRMYVNIKDLGNINQSLLTNLFYYLKPVNSVVILKQATI